MTMQHAEWGEPAPAPPDFLIGVDLGQRQDFTAVAVIERRQRPVANAPAPGPPSFIEELGLAPRPTGPTEAHYAVRWLERYPLGESYVRQVERTVGTVDRVRALMPGKRPGRLALIVDQTGAGQPVCDLFREAPALRGLEFSPITITAGDVPSVDPRGGWRAPKRSIVAVLQVILQSGRLKVAAGLPAAETLRRELLGFRAKITAAGNDVYAAGDDWRSAPHDDTVLAIGIALWYAEQAMSGHPAMSEAMEEAMSWQSRPEYPR